MMRVARRGAEETSKVKVMKIFLDFYSHVYAACVRTCLMIN